MDSLITILQFFFITDAKFIDWEDLKFYFSSEEEKQEHMLDKDNRISFHPSFPESNIYYLETIIVKYKNKEIMNFQFLVYIGKKNNMFIDLDEKGGPSFELLFYGKYEELIPTKIYYKNQDYFYFQNYGNKKRTRIFFANVDPIKLQYINSNEMKNHEFNFSEKSYQVLFRLYQKDKYEISMTDLESYLEYNLNCQQTKIKFSESDFRNITKMLQDFYYKYQKFISLNNQNIKNLGLNYYHELKEIAKKIINDKLYNFISEPDYYQTQYTKELLHLFHIDFHLNQFLKLSEEKPFNFIKTKDKVIDNQDKEEKLYNNLVKDENITMKQKIKILRAITILFKNSLLNDKNIFNVDYINIKLLPKENPYYKSNQMLKNIISEIDEESRLFEAFMYFDSKVIQNILEKNSQKKYTYKDAFGQNIEVDQPQFITEYGMSLMTIKEITKHLLDLLPEIIIRVDTNIEMRALFEDSTGIMIINEFAMFKNFCENNEKSFKKEPDRYVVPISMEILHEVFAHGKLRYNKKTDCSPLVIRDSKYDFKIQTLLQEVKIDLYKKKFVNKGETGKVLEHYISEDKNVIKTLKERTINTNIINTKFWTGKNFISLYKELNLYNENEKNLKFEKEIIFDDSDSDMTDYYDCILSH